MTDYVDAGLLAGMSATMAYWLLVGMTGMGLMAWRYRARFRNWMGLTVRDRADAVLSLSLCGFLAYAAFHRTLAAYSFAAQEWGLSNLTATAAPLYIVWALIAVAGLLWWICLEIFGPACHQKWWWLFIASGAGLGAGVSWRY